MGQIWNRISKLAKTYLQDSEETSTAERIINSDAEELKRIIDELSAPKKQQQPPPRQQKQQQQAPPPRPNTNGMTAAKATEILGVAKTATVQEIKSAYKKKAMQYHPDRMMNATQQEQQQAQTKIVEVNQAYQYLQLLKGF